MRISILRFAVAGLCTSVFTAPLIHAADSTPATTSPPAAGITPTTGAAAATTPGADTGGTLPTIVVSARRLNVERSSIETRTGASTYTIDSTAIAAAPGGENVQLNQVLLQAPDVVQDSFGQLHVRGDHNDLQYRLNGIILPEGISVFSQTLSPRLISSLQLITGALPAEYGLRTAGIIDLNTQSGLLQPGGSVSLYGGSHDTFQPSFEYGGGTGSLSYFFTADLLRSDLGIESPDASSEPLHDHTSQLHGFGYLEDILNDENRVSVILGTSNERFQIPDQHGLQPALGLDVDGQTDYLSNALNENQHELTQYAILSWQHSQGALNWQSSLSSRYTSLDFEPDWTGDLLYDGIAQNAFKGDTALAWQTDAAYQLDARHTLRAGLYLQHDSSSSDTTSAVLPLDASGAQLGEAPEAIISDGSQTQWIQSAYLQDEWKLRSDLTVNYGLRADHYAAYSSGAQLSPRVNLVWVPLPATTVHAGYSRYFTPPPFELIGGETLSRFAGTTAAPAVIEDTPPMAERADYYDLGLQQKLLTQRLTVGVDGYYEPSRNLIDEGQFGAPIILTPFNYRYGRIGGVEFTGNYTRSDFSAYANLAFQSAKGKDVESSQFNFDPDDLAYIADHYIHLDHEERVSASSGVSYQWLQTRFSLDMLFGTGLRQDLVLPDGFTIPNGDHTPSYTQFNLGIEHRFALIRAAPLTARLDVVNLFDKIYEIRSGSGIGVFASQYGARRGVFFGLAQDF